MEDSILNVLSELYLNGPGWLSCHESEWQKRHKVYTTCFKGPRVPESSTSGKKGGKNIDISKSAQDSILAELNKLANFDLIVRTIGYMLRWRDNVRRKKHGEPLQLGRINAEEYENSFKHLATLLQKKHYPVEYATLERWTK